MFVHFNTTQELPPDLGVSAGFRATRIYYPPPWRSPQSHPIPLRPQRHLGCPFWRDHPGTRRPPHLPFPPILGQRRGLKRFTARRSAHPITASPGLISAPFNSTKGNSAGYAGHRSISCPSCHAQVLPLWHFCTSKPPTRRRHPLSVAWWEPQPPFNRAIPLIDLELTPGEALPYPPWQAMTGYLAFC